MKILRIIDLEGNFIRDDFTFNEETEIALEVEPSQGLYQPKWNGTEWVEGLTQEEKDVIKNSATPTEPTIEDRVVTLEETIDVLFGGI